MSDSGEIPENEKSGVYDREGKRIKTEKGVSVYNYINGGITMPSLFGTAPDTFLMLIHSIWKNVYLVKGDEVGIGTDGEPLIQNVKILKLIRKAK